MAATVLSERGGWVPHENEGANRIRTRGIVGGARGENQGMFVDFIGDQPDATELFFLFY